MRILTLLDEMPPSCHWKATASNDPERIRELQEGLKKMTGDDLISLGLLEERKMDETDFGLTEHLICEVADRLEVLIAQNVGKDYKFNFVKRPTNETTRVWARVTEAVRIIRARQKNNRWNIVFSDAPSSPPAIEASTPKTDQELIKEATDGERTENPDLA